MYYNLTFKKATGITHAVVGNFLSSKQEIAVSKGRILELLAVDEDSQRLRVLSSVNIFGEIRSIQTFRPTGGARDYLVLGSNSGKIVILQYDSESKAFKKIFQETCSRNRQVSKIVGQHIAVDPRGHAVMMGAIEDLKCAVIVKHSQANHLRISPPIHVEKAKTRIYDMVGVDVGPGNHFVTFACLEAMYKEADALENGNINTDQQELNFYKLDLESTEIECEHTVVLEERSNFLVTVPGGCEGPGGVLVFSENVISYTKVGKPCTSCPIPRRINDLDSLNRSVIFVSCAIHSSESSFYFLAQSEFGDIFKISLTVEDSEVIEIKMKYFDSIPVASALCIPKPGFLFVASEFGNHALYKMKDFEGTEDEPVFSSAIPLEKKETFFFLPRALMHLECIQEVQSLSPIMQCQVASVGYEARFYLACGRGPGSTLRVLKQGFELSTKFSDCSLPNEATGVWTISKGNEDFIVVSFDDSTEVFKVGESIQKVQFPSIAEHTNTLNCRIMKHGVLVQISSGGISSRSISEGGGKSNWKAPQNQPIVVCAMNSIQVTIALSTGVVVYFEMSNSRELRAHRVHKRMQSQVKCMELSSSEDKAGRAAFLVVGLEDASVCVLSLDFNDLLHPAYIMSSLPGVPTSLLFTDVGVLLPEVRSTLQLFVGLQNGNLLISHMAEDSGVLSACELQQLESEPVQMFECRIKGRCAVMIISSHTWLYFYDEDKASLIRLVIGKAGSAFCFSDRWLNSFVAASHVLRIITVGESLKQTILPLYFTPRKFVVDPLSGNLFIIETDHNALTKRIRYEKRQSLKREITETEKDEDLAVRLSSLYCEDKCSESIPSAPAGHGMWASAICVVNHEGEEVCCVPLEQNKAAFSLALTCQGNKQFLFVGLANDMKFNMDICEKGTLQVYAISNEGTLKLVREVNVKGVPSAMSPFGSRILVGIGRWLRLYSFTNNKLAVMCECECVGNQIISVIVCGENIIIGDLKENLVYLKYEEELNALKVFTRDQDSSFLTTTCFLDSKHIARADIFGNVFIVKLPLEFIDKVPPNPSMKDFSNKLWLRKYPPQSEIIAVFYVGETVLSLQKTCLFPGGSEVLMYATLSGTIGVIGKLSSPEDVLFVGQLEKLMQSEHPALCGQDHFTFRSCHHSVKNIVDGDFCEQFEFLDPEVQKHFADIMGMVPGNIIRKLAEVRSRFIF